MNSVPIQSLRQVWPSVRPLLEELAIKTKQNWIAEDIYTEVLTGKARLFLVEGGVLVTVPQVEEFTGANVLHVWCGIGQGHDYESSLEELKEHAREFGFQKITFESNREGWKKRFPIESIRYRIEL